jgi:hypothetical protein
MPYADREEQLAYHRKKHQKNRAEYNARRKAAYHAADKNEERAKRRAWYVANRAKALALERARQYKVRYGISVEQYEAMLASQNGKCKICFRSDAGHQRLKHFCVDHCHKTGVVRGLLCLKCNSSLGWFEAHHGRILPYLSGE